MTKRLLIHIVQLNNAPWAARVRSLAANCRFNKEMLEMLMRDRFIIGFEKGPVQDRLFEEEINAKFSAVITVASSKMAARQNTALEPQFIKTEPVHHVFKQNEKSYSVAQPSTSGRNVRGGVSNQKCSVCGRNNHVSEKCRYRDYTCNLCNMKGHLAPACNKKNKNSAGLSKKRVQNYIEAGNDELFSIYSCSVSDEPYFIDIHIDNKKYSFQLDSGASISAIPKEFYELHFSHY